ncbi:MAG: DUF1015 family protein, partial [Candidatus Dormibacteria bacterium]
EGHRLGLFGRVAALAWNTAPIRPHETTLSGPKRDRLALLRTTRMHTSAVFGLWDGAPGLAECLHRATAGPANAEGTFPGEVGDETMRLWTVTDPELLGAIQGALIPARLYIADGHHRYETAAAYAQERRAADPGAPADADFTTCLVYLCAVDDPGLVLWPTHRLIRPRAGVPTGIEELLGCLGGRFLATRTASLGDATSMAAAHPSRDHAFAVVTADGSAVLSRERDPGATPRQQLDVAVLEDQLLRPLSLTADDLRAGALLYERDPEAVQGAVSRGEAAVGIVLRGCRVEDMLAIASAGETMPQKSTYFYPKVPTGVVLASA